MESLAQQITALLGTRFPGSEIELEENYVPGKVGGRIVWGGFDGIELPERHDAVRAAIREGLTAGQFQEVSVIYTFTPDEMAAILED